MPDPTGFTINRGSGGTFTLVVDSTGGEPVFASTSGVPIADPPNTSGYQLRGVYTSGDPLTSTGDGYNQLGGPLAGVSASPLGTTSFWANLNDSSPVFGVFPWTGNIDHNADDIDQLFGIGETIGSPNTNEPFVFLDTYNVSNPEFNSKGPFNSTPAVGAGKWYNVLMSWNTNFVAGSRILQIYVNDVAKTSTPVSGNDVGIAFATQYPSFVDTFAFNSGSGIFPQGDVWFAPGVFLDFTVTANRRKFIDGSGNPVYLGMHGEIPLGVEPAMFFTVPPTATSCLVRATTSKSSGKYGFAMQQTATDASGALGLAGPLAPTNEPLGFDPNGWGLKPSGALVHNNVTITTIASYALSDWVQVEVDVTARLMWIRTNNGNWNNSGTANPETLVGGISIPGTSTLFPAVSLVDHVGGSYKANFGATPFLYPLTPSYAPWLPPST